MPGRWVLDNDQSLYYVDSQDPLNSPEPTLLTEEESATDSEPIETIPFRFQKGIRGLSTNFAAWDGSANFFSPPGLASTINYQLTPSISCTEQNASEVDWTPDSQWISRDTISPDANGVNSTSPDAYGLASEISSADAYASAGRNDDRLTTSPNHQTQSNDCEGTLLLGNRKALGSFHRATLLDQTFCQPTSGLNLVMGYNTRFPQSRLDKYITALRQLIRCSAERYSIGNDLRRAVTAEGVLWAVREAWPAAEGYWNLTATFRGFLHAELWRNFPCERSYSQLPPAYRPTRAQLCIPHSPMIDWMPWPDLRDLAILYQDQIDVDALFRMAIHNVVAHRKGLDRKRLSQQDHLARDSGLVDDLNDKVSFRVWDLVCLEKSNGTNPLAEPGLEKKPVLRSPGGRALLRAYNLEYDEFDTQKLDDCFFEAYPCLYCDTAASGWKVKNFPSIPSEDVGRPIDLTASAVFRLKSKIESMIGGEIEI